MIRCPRCGDLLPTDTAYPLPMRCRCGGITLEDTHSTRTIIRVMLEERVLRVCTLRSD